MQGPGKYDAECKAVVNQTEADGAILIIFGGKRGSGMATIANAEALTSIPGVLRYVADMIEKDMIEMGGKA
jgi:hypothetical protein